MIKRSHADVALWLCFLLSTNTMAATDTTFAVSDTIRLTRLVDPEGHFKGQSEFHKFKFSPDGRWFVIVTRRGRMDVGENIYSLISFNVDDVRAYLRLSDGAAMPKSVVLASFSIAAENDMSDRDAIDQVHWCTDSRTIAFIGRGTDGRGQVYVADVNTHDVRQVSHSSFDVAAFDFSPNSGRLVYAAYVPPDWRSRNERGYAFEAARGDNALLLTAIDSKLAAPYNIKYYAEELRTSTPVSIDVRPSYARVGDISISPSGKWAIIANTVWRIPEHWQAYDFVQANPMLEPFPPTHVAAAGDEPAVHFNDAFSSPDSELLQYQLVDLATGRSRPLVDAPTPTFSYWVDKQGRLRIVRNLLKASWSPDGQRVLLPPTYVAIATPGIASDAIGKTRVLQSVEIPAGLAEPILVATRDRSTHDLPVSLIDSGWRTPSAAFARYQIDSGEDVVTIREEYALRDGRWTKLRSRQEKGTDIYRSGTPVLRLRVAQDMNVPPNIAALDERSGREKLITDLNPQLSTVSLAPARVFEWSDKWRRKFSGALVLPRSYKEGDRCPIVIQPGVFLRHVFLLDGYGDIFSSYAAQALANQGIAVLQMEDTQFPPPNAKAHDYESTYEGPLFVAETEAAIDALHSQGLIDRSRVGMNGFSRRGMYVHYFLTFSSYAIAAATVADSVSLSPRSYASYYGLPYRDAGMDGWDTERPGLGMTIGAPFIGDGIQLWIERSDLFHLDRIRTPIRYEAYGPWEPLYWEYYAILKRASRPVELFQIPEASHNLKAPHAVYASKQGNVDWFRFWLTGWEDSDPGKREQYERWRNLRVQQDHHLKELQAAQN